MTRSASVNRPGPAPAAADDVAALRTIAEVAGDAAFIVDCATRSLCYLSPAALDLLGYPHAGFAAQLAAPGQAGPLAPLCAGLDERLRRFAAGDGSRLRVVREFDVERADGRRVPVELISALVLDDALVPRAVAGIIRDQSERRARAAEQKRFASMLNHEFRTPLSTIDGAIQRLEATAAHADEPTRQRYRKIATAVDRLIGMLDQYLSPERMAAIGRTRAPGGIAPRQLLEEGAAQARAAGRPVQLLAEELPPSLRCDPQGLRLVVKVLVDNALAFSPPGSAIDLSGRIVANGIELLVQDHGGGVPADDVPRIFEKSYRGSNAAGLPGNGLGLYMARSVLEVHGGTLELLPQARGSGASFEIFLPMIISEGKVVASREPSSDNRYKQAGVDARIGAHTITTTMANP
jgi:signal transduction histidine kinase